MMTGKGLLKKILTFLLIGQIALWGSACMPTGSLKLKFVEGPNDPNPKDDDSLICKNEGQVETRTRYKDLRSLTCEQEIQTRTCIDGKWGAWNGQFQQLSCQIINPPQSIIALPSSSVVNILEGQSVTFEGLYESEEEEVLFHWTFGRNSGVSDNTRQIPGSITFNTVGAFNVSFTVSTALGVKDPTPATVLVNVSPIDPVPPAISQLLPNSELPYGTTQTTMSLVTSKAATCKYSTDSQKIFSAMEGSFTSSNGINHSKLLQGLSNGARYQYYILCANSTGVSASTPVMTSFSVSNNDPNLPAPVITNPLPNGTLAYNLTQTQISVVTDKAATCRYSNSSSTAYNNMTLTMTKTNDELSHSATVTGLTSGTTYNYYVRCINKSNVANTTSMRITFSIDTAPDLVAPVITNPLPTGTLTYNLTQTQISVVTNKAATCRYSNSSSTAYNNMTLTMTKTNDELNHSATVTGLTSGTTYNYYVRCINKSNVANTTSTRITFSIDTAPDLVAPVITNPLPTGTLAYTITQTQISVVTNKAATCRYSNSASTTYNNMTLTMNKTNDELNHSATVTGLTSGTSYTYYVRCINKSNVANTTSVSIRFSINQQSDGVIEVSWNPNPENQFVLGYKIYVGSTASQYDGSCLQNPATSPINITVSSLPDPSNPSYRITNVARGCYLVITAYNQIGESEHSEEYYSLP